MKYKYGALAELYWQGKPKYLEKNLSQCHSVHHKTHKNWPGIKADPPWWEASNLLPKPKHSLNTQKNKAVMKLVFIFFLQTFKYFTSHSAANIHLNFPSLHMPSPASTTKRFQNCNYYQYVIWWHSLHMFFPLLVVLTNSADNITHPGLCGRPITCPEKSYQVWSQDLNK